MRTTPFCSVVEAPAPAVRVQCAAARSPASCIFASRGAARLLSSPALLQMEEDFDEAAAADADAADADADAAADAADADDDDDDDDDDDGGGGA